MEIPAERTDGRFRPGHPKLAGSGRKKGTPNKIDASMEELRASADAPEDPLEFLLWVQMNPRARLALRVKCAADRAQYKYSKKRDVTFHGDLEPEVLDARLRAGRDRLAAENEQESPELPA